MMACLLRPSSVSMSTSMEITFDCSFCIRLLLLGSQGGASLSDTSPDSMDHWNWYTKLGPLFPPLLFYCNFRPNDNQTFIVSVKSTQVPCRKGLCGFFWFGDSPWKKSYVEQSVASFTEQREYFIYLFHHIEFKFERISRIQQLHQKVIKKTRLNFWMNCISN